MRRVMLVVVTAMLAAVLAARYAVERPASPAMAADRYWDESLYNVLPVEPDLPEGTAGSARLAELNEYYLGREPTRKSGYTGLLAGQSLVLVLAEDWVPGRGDPVQTPGLLRLQQQAVRFTGMYAPEWYQGADGRQFALLAGMTPTVVGERSSMDWVGRQGTYLPWALGTCLRAAGYDCRAYPAQPDRDDAYRALGFAPREAGDWSGRMDEVVPPREAGPFAAYVQLAGRDGEQALEGLWQALAETGRAGDTAVCLVSGGAQPLRGGLWIWSAALAPEERDAPCSEMDVGATLLDLLGAEYDARFLTGRDALADDAGTAPVSLYGSAYAGWVTRTGSYDAGADLFTPADKGFSSAQETARYVARMRQAVYRQYTYDRLALECDYFQAVLGR